MKITRTVISGLSFATLLQTTLAQQEEFLSYTDDTTGDIVIRLLDQPPPPPQAEETRERNRIREKVLAALPYGYTGNALYSLGQMAKVSDRIFVGKIKRVEAGSDSSSRRLSIGVETNLFGKVSRSITEEMDLSAAELQRIKTGNRVLVFQSDGMFAHFSPDSFRFDFDKTKIQEVPRETDTIIFSDGEGIIILDNAESRKAFLSALDGYLKILRRGERDPEAYYEFLLELSQSPVERIRNDAKSDLACFLESVTSFDLNHALENKRVDDSIKNYVRLIVIPDREKAELEKAEQQKKGKPEPQ